MEWHSNICFICFDEFTLSKPRTFFHDCIHAMCIDCVHLKLDYNDFKKIKVIDAKCSYGHCNKPMLEEILGRNLNIHVLNKDDSVYVYNYSTYDIPVEARLIRKDKLQEIMIKSQGLKIPEANEKTKLQIAMFEK
jgi:hypothetical protein